MACHVCEESADSKGNEILLCDGEGCSLAYHMGCLQPALHRVPRGKWLCPECNTKHKAQRQADRSAQKKARHVVESLSCRRIAVVELVGLHESVCPASNL